MTDQTKAPPAETSTPALELAYEPPAHAQLTALAAAGSFVEQRISRGQRTHDERTASDEIMGQIAELLRRDDGGRG